jgi:hypothetical protein
MGINCSTAGQLQLVLARTGSAPLDLFLGWEVDQESLQLLNSRDQEIRSLYIEAGEVHFVESTFDGLDVSHLKRLDLHGLQWEDVARIMSMSLNSNHEAMHIVISSLNAFTNGILRHGLLQRATDLELVSCKYMKHRLINIKLNHIDNRESSSSTFVTIPGLKRLDISGSKALLRSFDLKGVNILRFSCGTGERLLTLTSFPTQLTELTLENVTFASTFRY